MACTPTVPFSSLKQNSVLWQRSRATLSASSRICDDDQISVDSTSEALFTLVCVLIDSAAERTCSMTAELKMQSIATFRFSYSSANGKSGAA